MRKGRVCALRLGIDLEAQALISNSGRGAYWVALQRAEEASSVEMARDWSGVAAVIARRTEKRPSLLAWLH
jgi:hypothetical protein